MSKREIIGRAKSPWTLAVCFLVVGVWGLIAAPPRFLVEAVYAVCPPPENPCASDEGCCNDVCTKKPAEGYMWCNCSSCKNGQCCPRVGPNPPELIYECCGDGKHCSGGHCCPDGEEWCAAKNMCTCECVCGGG